MNIIEGNASWYGCAYQDVDGQMYESFVDTATEILIGLHPTDQVFDGNGQPVEWWDDEFQAEFEKHPLWPQLWEDWCNGRISQ